MMLAFGQIRLAPQDFWRMSPCELQAAIDGFSGGLLMDAAPVLNRAEFGVLHDQYPDQ